MFFKTHCGENSSQSFQQEFHITIFSTRVKIRKVSNNGYDHRLEMNQVQMFNDGKNNIFNCIIYEMTKSKIMIATIKVNRNYFSSTQLNIL